MSSQTAEARLPALEEQAQALREREIAGEQSEEAQRLGQATAAVKRETKTRKAFVATPGFARFRLEIHHVRPCSRGSIDCDGW